MMEVFTNQGGLHFYSGGIMKVNKLLCKNNNKVFCTTFCLAARPFSDQIKARF